MVKRNDNTTENKQYDDDKLSKIFRYIIFIIFMIIMLVIIVTNIKENNDIKELELKEEQEEERQDKLKACISTAKNDRSDLWNSNCTEEADGKCTIKNNSGTIDWIEQRYEQDINNCYELYGN